VDQLHRSPGVFFDHDRGKAHSSGKVLYSARIIPYRGSWLDFEFDAKDILYSRIDRRRKIPATIILRALDMSTSEILERFYEVDDYKIDKDSVITKLVPQRLRGEALSVDLKIRNKVIVEANKRITARHVRQLESFKTENLKLPKEYLLNKVTAKDIFDQETGEVILPANTVIDEEVLDNFEKNNILDVSCLYINELDKGPYISTTLRSDPTTNRLEALVEICQMMRSGEPPTRDSA